MTIQSPRGAFQRNVAKLTIWLALAAKILLVSGCGETATRRSDATSEASHLDATIDKTLDDRPSIDADDASDGSFDVTADGGSMDAMGDASPDADAGAVDPYGDCTVPRFDGADAAPPACPRVRAFALAWRAPRGVAPAWKTAHGAPASARRPTQALVPSSPVFLLVSSFQCP